jgi:hypothetical protein
MLRSEVEQVLAERPFVPLAIHLVDGTVVRIPFAHVAIPFARTLLVLLGVTSETSRSATGKVEFGYERIDRISRPRVRGGQPRKKAS